VGALAISEGNLSEVSELQTIAVADLVPHPDNPRLRMREDVVEQLAAEISRHGFGKEHALLVRPVPIDPDPGVAARWEQWKQVIGTEYALPWEGQHQILSGHHRAEAAKRAGVGEVPCWVKDLDDDEAFMQLVLANTQGELSPLEIGMHALKAVPLADGGRGKRGGLSEYATRIGRTGEYIGQLRNAADVLLAVQTPNLSLEFISGKAKHLYEISKAPRGAWPFLVDRLAARGWSVTDTGSQVDKVRKFNIPAGHAYWLPYAAVVETYLRSDRLNPAAVAKLISTAEGVFSYIDGEGIDEDRASFTAWLRDHAGKEAWDARSINRYHQDLIRKVAERRAAELEAAAEDEEPRLPDGVTLLHGDFREVFAEDGPDGDGEDEFPAGSVDAIITDPPYPAKFLDLFGRTPPRVDPDTMISHYSEFESPGLAEIAARILKPGGVCAVMVGQSYLPEIIARLSDSLTYHWTISYLTPGGQAVQLWDRKVNTFWKPVLIFTKGAYAGDWFGDVTRSDVNDNDKQHHYWGQSESGMADLIDRLTKPGQLICDPFLGGGTTAVVAHALGRRFVGCDIDETCVETTAARFADAEGAAA
jgi:site-specific DNA-methyltransferase (adenine-specific)